MGISLLHLLSSEVAQYCLQLESSLGYLPQDWWLVANAYNRASIHSSPSHPCLLGSRVVTETGKSVSPFVT